MKYLKKFSIYADKNDYRNTYDEQFPGVLLTQGTGKTVEYRNYYVQPYKFIVFKNYGKDILYPCPFSSNRITSTDLDGFPKSGDLRIKISDRVNYIDENAFSDYRTSLNCLYIPPTIASIGSGAFNNMQNRILRLDISDLERWCQISFSTAASNPLIARSDISISTESDLQYNNIFLNGERITKIDISNSNIYLQQYCFGGFRDLVEVKLGYKNAIPTGAFAYCCNLRRIDTTSVRDIGNYAFANCSVLSDIDIRNVRTIGNYAFAGTAIEEVVLPSSLTTLGSNVFMNSALSKITFPENSFTCSNTTSLFSGCSKLNEITLPTNFMAIGDYMFHNCGNLESVVIPPSVMQIGQSAFRYCSRLKELTIPESVTTIKTYAFYEVSRMEKMTFLSTTPPNIGSSGNDAFGGRVDYDIYVPSESLNAYKTANVWSKYADWIKPIQS